MPSIANALNLYMGNLLEGKRAECAHIFNELCATCEEPRDLFSHLIWPAMERVEKLYRQDRINTAIEHMATRINRQLADRVRPLLGTPTPNTKRILIICADDEPEELGAQMTADLFEADGWQVCFAGGGIPNDEVLSLAGQYDPHILLVFGTRPQGVPGIRKLIDTLREIGVCATMNVMISGGVFNRADGLWQEVAADLFAPTAAEALQLANSASPREPKPPTAGLPKKRRRRRRSPYLQSATA